MTTINGSLRVWWIPQVPMKPFYVPVRTLREAALVLDTLSNYDAFQYENLVKGDYSNAGGLQRYDAADIQDDDPETGWTDWYDDETGADFDDYREGSNELS
jgi:hypothetical protein